jgi:hypothetical protein
MGGFTIDCRLDDSWLAQRGSTVTMPFPPFYSCDSGSCTDRIVCATVTKKTKDPAL